MMNVWCRVPKSWKHHRKIATKFRKDSCQYKVPTESYHAMNAACGCPNQNSNKTTINGFRVNQVRTLHTTGVNRDQEKNTVARILTVQNPFRYISIRIKIFLLRAYFDKDFDVDQFIIGAKQAVTFVSSQLAEGKFAELNDVMTSEGIQSGRQLYLENDSKTASLRVDENDFLNVSMSDICFEYGEGGRKWAYILVVYFCTAKEAVTKTFGDIDVVATPTRILKYSFRREYTPGIKAGWLVDRLESLKTPSMF